MPKNIITVKIGGDEAHGKVTIMQKIIAKAFKDFDMHVMYPRGENEPEITVQYEDTEVAFIEHFHD